MKEKKSNSAIEGFIWKALEQYGILGIQFIIQVIIARILEPHAYGTIAIVTVFIAISNVFIQNGFSVALVQRREINKEDISSVFQFSIIIAIVFYSIIFFTSRHIATYFSMPELKELLRVMSICLFPQTYSSIQNALLRRLINFKAVFISSILSVGISGIAAIIAAYKGMGVWALVLQQILYSFLVVIAQSYQIKWFPLLRLNLKKSFSYLSFGWKVLAASLVSEIFSEIRNLAIGKYYSSADLSFFNRGKQYPNLLMKSVNGSLQAVLLPKLASNQDRKKTQHDIIHKSISTSAYLMFPLLTLLAVSATPMVTWMLTEKWLPCVVYIQLHCLYYATWPITTTNAQTLYSIGRSDIVLKAEFLRKIIDLTILFLTIKLGVVAITIGAVLVSILSVPIYIYPSQKHLDYKILRQIKDITAPVILSGVMGCIVYSINFFHWNAFLIFSTQIILGLTIYIVLSYTFKVRAFIYVIKILKDLRKKC